MWHTARTNDKNDVKSEEGKKAEPTVARITSKMNNKALTVSTNMTCIWRTLRRGKRIARETQRGLKIANN